ncbi:hypothetical protein PoB_007346600 [Plakobranchus ocellatus]|uniref:Uncharacterized protein n=1 Tax=Plakobranchus ocellatus TaxID=259542 RepID=A0AAV4DST7_9GAST|nr:hypothetical protein PoB_007346600 [Plakobranchus ocellatus]
MATTAVKSAKAKVKRNHEKMASGSTRSSGCHNVLLQRKVRFLLNLMQQSKNAIREELDKGQYLKIQKIQQGYSFRPFQELVENGELMRQ